MHASKYSRKPFKYVSESVSYSSAIFCGDCKITWDCNYIEILSCCVRSVCLYTAVASTQVLEYYSNSRPLEHFLQLEYSLLFISGCKFPFRVAVFCSQLMNCSHLWKRGAS